MPSTDREQLPRRRSNRELLDHIYAEGERFRRRRRRLNVVGALTGVVALAGGAAVAAQLPGRSTPQSVAARGVAAPASPGSSTPFTTTTVEPLELPPELHMTTVPPPAPAPPASTAPPPNGTATTAAAPPSVPVPPAEGAASEQTPDQAATRVAAGAAGGAAATMAAPGDNVVSRSSVGGPAAPPAECLNSADAACGPFRWEPDPGPDAPLVVTVSARPRLGDPRTFDFFVVYEDGDATIREDCRLADFGDGGTVAASSCAVPACLATYGPWTPPAKEPGSAEASATHTFSGPGTYVVRFSAASGGMCGHPYASTGTGSTEVVVP